MSTAGTALRVVIAEDAAIMRDGLTQTLTRRGLDVVAAGADAGVIVPSEHLEIGNQISNVFNRHLKPRHGRLERVAGGIYAHRNGAFEQGFGVGGPLAAGIGRDGIGPSQRVPGQRRWRCAAFGTPSAILAMTI
jgi:hypothetical protein